MNLGKCLIISRDYHSNLVQSYYYQLDAPEVERIDVFVVSSTSQPPLKLTTEVESLVFYGGSLDLLARINDFRYDTIFLNIFFRYYDVPLIFRLLASRMPLAIRCSNSKPSVSKKYEILYGNQGKSRRLLSRALDMSARFLILALFAVSPPAIYYSSKECKRHNFFKWLRGTKIETNDPNLNRFFSELHNKTVASNSKARLAVYVDQDLPEHPDFFAGSGIDPLQFYTELFALFVRLRDVFDYNVIVAAHPARRNNIEDSYGFDVIVGETPSLIGRADIVLGHFSGALLLAYTLRKRVFIVQLKSMLNCDYILDSQTLISEATGSPIMRNDASDTDIDNMLRLNVDLSKYESYIESCT